MRNLKTLRKKIVIIISLRTGSLGKVNNAALSVRGMATKGTLVGRLLGREAGRDGGGVNDTLRSGPDGLPGLVLGVGGLHCDLLVS